VDSGRCWSLAGRSTAAHRPGCPLRAIRFAHVSAGAYKYTHTDRLSWFVAWWSGGMLGLHVRLRFGKSLRILRCCVWVDLLLILSFSLQGAPPVGLGRVSGTVSAHGFFGSGAPVLVPRPAPTLATLRLSGWAPPGPLPAVAASERAAVYQRGLAAAARTVEASLAASTYSRQESAAREFSAWLARYGGGRTVLDCTPDDVLVYITAHWLPGHSGRQSSEPGPSAVKSHLSLLSGALARVGREGRYNALTGEGNPCACSWVEDYRKGYQRQQMLAGYQEVSAVPLTEAKYEALVRYLWREISRAAGALAVMVLLRDLLVVLLLWQTAQRGHDVGKLGLGDFVDPSRPEQPYLGFPLPAPWELLGGAPTLCVSQRGTKTYRLGRAPAIWIWPNAEAPGFCVPRVLGYYMWLSRQPDAAPGSRIDDLLFRPLTPDQRGFKSAALRTSTLSARLKLHLQAAGLYAGETVHSFRRGALQTAAGGGASDAELMGLSHIRTPAVLGRYLDTERHLRDKRARL
jgi:integrase